MDRHDQSLHSAETLASLYLVAPLFIFFAFFIRLVVAVPACALIVLLVLELTRRTAWRVTLQLNWQTAYLLLLAALWVWLSGGIGEPHQNGDWYKHYEVINFLTRHSWPPTEYLPYMGESTLRYYIGWYLVPSVVLKVTGLELQTLAMSAWSILGVFLFFNLLTGIVGRRWGVLVAPLVFIVFSGADFLGTVITENYPPADHHFEWWTGWVQFSSNTTALFWVPQHAISAWIGVALLMRFRERPAFLPYCGLLLSAVLLWSPFSAIGLVPFLLALAFHHGLRPFLLDWRSIATGTLLAIPICLYLAAGAGNIPHGYIATEMCGFFVEQCFTWTSYAVFLLLEITAPVAILLLHREREHGFVVAAAIALLLVPLYRIGWAHDFGMRASLPALAVLSILCVKVIGSHTRWLALAMLVTLLIGVPTPAGEIARAFLPGYDIPPDTVIPETYPEGYAKYLLVQYFAPLPLWVLR